MPNPLIKVLHHPHTPLDGTTDILRHPHHRLNMARIGGTIRHPRLRTMGMTGDIGPHRPHHPTTTMAGSIIHHLPRHPSVTMIGTTAIK